MNYENDLIFGKDKTSHIVNITLKNDVVHIYTEKDNVVSLEKFDYTPWVLSHEKIRPYSEKLKGNQYWTYLTSTTCDKYKVLAEDYQRDLWLPRSIEECFTLCEGTTLFKGMKVSDVSILSFDIETSGLKMDKSSCVYIISNTLRKSNGQVIKKLFSLDEHNNNQLLLINSWLDWVKEQNPSILCGHNILSYDLPYLNYCYKGLTNHNLSLGRDSSEIEFDSKLSKKRKDGSQQYEYHNARITGREIVDTFFLALSYDIGREFPSYGLKPIVKHLGLEKTGRSFIDASKIKQYYQNRLNDEQQWEKVKQYALEDSEDSLKLFDMMIPAYFYLAQSTPKSLQQMVNEASGSQIDSMMIRSYLQNGYSQPRTSGKQPFEGAISMGIPGRYNYVMKADVASLYPSIMLEYNIFDEEKDPNGNMIKILSYFRDERLKNKKLAKDTKDKYYDDMQNAQKILINSMYGFLGAKYLLYNYPKGGAEVTRHGREILLKGVEWATGYTLERTVKDVVNAGKENEEINYHWVLGKKVGEGQGYTLCNVDTDSFSITKNAVVSKEQFSGLLQNLNSIYPNLIKWEDDGIYEKVIVIRAKNYVLVKDGKVKIKGSGITDQKKEPALTEMLETMIKCLLANEDDSLKSIYDSYIKEAVNIKDINRWATKKTITASVLNPARSHEQKVLDAINEAISHKIMEGVQEGDKIWVYDAVRGVKQQMAKGEPVFFKNGEPKMVPNCVLRVVNLWENDQNAEHYINRVYDTANILSNVLPDGVITDYGLKSNKDLLNTLTNSR